MIELTERMLGTLASSPRRCDNKGAPKRAVPLRRFAEKPRGVSSGGQSLRVLTIWAGPTDERMPSCRSIRCCVERSFNSPISVSIEVLIYFVFLVYLKRFGVNLWVAISICNHRDDETVRRLSQFLR